MKSKKEICDLALIFLFWSLIVVISVATLIKNPQEISKSEGRALAQFPDASINSIINGEYFEGLRDFYSDQLALKSSFTKIYASNRLALGDREINGVVLCKNSALVARTDTKNENILQKNLDTIKDLCNRSSSALLFVAPDSIQVYENHLPTLLKRSIVKETFINARFYKKASSDSEKYYYKTDHHWTSAGAFEAYREICRELSVKALDEVFFTKQTVTQSFCGSAYRRSALPLSFVTPDQITLYRYDGDSEFSVKDIENSTTLCGMYDLDELSGADPYRVFLGGNYAHISTENESVEKRARMLIIKDSFANSVIPFLAYHYDLDIVDPRYATVQTAKSISLDDFDAVLVLCSNNTLSTEEAYGDFIELILK